MPATVFTEATVSFTPLHSADGSVIFEQDGFSIIGSVNGPIEIMKRDEHPEEAVVDVVVRPAVGVGGKRHPKVATACSTQLTHQRYKGAPSRVHHPAHSSPAHSDSKLPANSDTGHTSNRKDTEQRDAQPKVISGIFGNIAPLLIICG